MDDTLFVWAARQIAHHFSDPYGFQLIWDTTQVSMADVTQNPPLSSYYAALVGVTLGWSERALHCGFMLFAVAFVLGTYRLAQEFTRLPLLAALAALLTPGVLVSACSVMCDTMMLAIWVWSLILWLEGLKRGKPYLFVASGLLISACALTKYFGVSLIPLLLVYTSARLRRLSAVLLWLLIPVVVLAAYQAWTAGLYGHGLLSVAADFAASQRAATRGSVLSMAIVGLSFAGGCALLGLIFAPLVWSPKQIAIAAVAAGIASLAAMAGWLDMGLQLGGRDAIHSHLVTGSELFVCVAAGISLLGLAIEALLKMKADGLLLGLWLLGTLCFAAFVNYTVNARSVLPLIPVAGILLARRVDQSSIISNRNFVLIVTGILVASGAFSMWIAAADTSLANSARTAATIAYEKAKDRGSAVWFEGHWGFQYYMQALGAGAVDFAAPQMRSGDFVVIPENNVQTGEIASQFVASRESFQLPQDTWATTISWTLGAGFYSSYWGPLPYAVGKVPPERYSIVRLRQISAH